MSATLTLSLLFLPHLFPGPYHPYCTTVFIVVIAAIEGAGGADGFEPLQVPPTRASRRRNRHGHAVRQGATTSNRPLAQAHSGQVQPLLVYPHFALCSILLIYCILRFQRSTPMLSFPSLLFFEFLRRYPISVNTCCSVELNSTWIL